MGLITHGFKQLVTKLVERLSAPDYSADSAAPSVADTKMLAPQSSEARLATFRLVSDEPKSIGGGETAPTPSSIFVASIGFAENVIFARQAALNDLDFESFETKVEAKWDRRGMFGINHVDSAISEVLIQTKIETSAAPEKIAQLVKMNDSRCPMTATVAKAARIKRRLFVNGKEISMDGIL